MTSRTAIAATFGLLGLAGCGSSGASADGERRSFDVVATLSSPGGGTLNVDLPPTVAFTLVFDLASNRVVAGGKGVSSASLYTRTNGGGFKIAGLTVGSTLGGVCGGANSIELTSLELTVSGSSLRGTGLGVGRVSCGDCLFMVPFTAQFDGAPDATPPTLLPSGATPSSPFAPFTLVPSEPLPATATARLVGNDGSVVELEPIIAEGYVPLVQGFRKPDVVLPGSDGFVVALDGLVDFAGHRGASDVPLRFAAFGAPPLVPEDGFESVTGAEVGGATIIGGGALAPITGSKSAYFGPEGAPSPGGVAPGTALRVRLAVQRGDTKLRYSYRSVSFDQGLGFVGGEIHAGSVGREIATQTLGGAALGAQMMWPNGQLVSVSDVVTGELALPADITDEVMVAFELSDVRCGGLITSPTGLLVDDLRLE